MAHIILKEESYAIIGACMKVHNEMGHGFRESVYQECLGKEFRERNIDFARQKRLKLNYKGENLDKYFVADFLCYNSIVLEIKAAEYLIRDYEIQLLNYLKATNYKLGLLINFGQSSLRFKRIVN